MFKKTCSDLACMKYRITIYNYNIIVSVFKNASRVASIYYLQENKKTLTKTLNVCYGICFVSPPKKIVCLLV